MKYLIEKEDIENADWGRVALNNDNEIMLKGFLSTDMFFSGVVVGEDNNYTITVTYEDGSEEVIHIPYDAETKAFKYIFSKPVGKMKLNPTYIDDEIGGKYIIYESITNFPNQSNLTDGQAYFRNCYATNINLRNFNSSKITNMSEMFYGISIQTIDVSKMNTSSVTDMSRMFSDARSVSALDLSSFDTSNVTNMSNMFNRCSGLEFLNLTGLDTSNVTNMSGMFSGVEALPRIVGLRTLDTSNVTDMSRMFQGTYGLNTEVSNFNTSNVTNMHGMFMRAGRGGVLDLSNFNTSNVTDMGEMFSSYVAAEINISSFDTSKVTDMGWMFYSCYGLTIINISSFDTSKVTDMGWMFYSCYGLTILNFGNFNVSNVTNMYDMFTECSKLTTVTGTFEGTKVDLDLYDCPLTNSSAMVFINGLANVSETRQITFKSTTYDTLTPEQISVATSKGWTVVRHA